MPNNCSSFSLDRISKISLALATANDVET